MILTKKQQILRKLTKLLFIVIFILLIIGQFIDFSSNPSWFIYYYAAIGILTLSSFVFTIWDIRELKKTVKEL